jgi:hypothetical protein
MPSLFLLACCRSRPSGTGTGVSFHRFFQLLSSGQERPLNLINQGATLNCARSFFLAPCTYITTGTGKAAVAIAHQADLQELNLAIDRAVEDSYSKASKKCKKDDCPPFPHYLSQSAMSYKFVNNGKALQYTITVEWVCSMAPLHPV